jgi:type II secretion system protein C
MEVLMKPLRLSVALLCVCITIGVARAAPETRPARLVPRMHDGQLVGFNIYAIAPGSLFADVGLQNGDHLLALDGVALRSPADAQRLWDRVMQHEVSTIEVERRGERLTLDTHHH